jgi:hypothetical protein
MAEIVSYALCLIGSVVSLADWRRGLLLWVIIDVVRDPLRKLTDSQSVVFTLMGIIPLGVALLRAFSVERSELRLLIPRYPRMNAFINFPIVALLPAALISIISYDYGVVLAGMGAIAYLSPILAVVIGYTYVRTSDDFLKLIKLYVVVNAVALISVQCEAAGYDWPWLGGINYTWVRHFHEETFRIYCGSYRSPDVMGLHAANAGVYCILLAIRSKGSLRGVWGLLLAWTMYCLLLAGRRKMFLIPVVFLLVAIVLYWLYSHRRVAVGLGLAAIMAVSAFAGVAAMKDSNRGPRIRKSESVDYVLSTFSDASDRFQQLGIQSTWDTITASGLFGEGLGSIMQGRHFVATSRRLRSGANSYQEDGVSRIFGEFGVFGVALLLAAAFALLQVLHSAFKLTQESASVRELQIGCIAIVAGNAASFVVAHQHFSGDPGLAIMVAIFVGIVLGMPRLIVHETETPLRRPADLLA